MKNKFIPVIGVGVLLLIMFILPVMAAESDVGKLSSNIPLNSYIYTDLAKLEGLGYLKDMPNGTKPYTRMRVAQWLRAIREQVMVDDRRLPGYIHALLSRLETEFSPELAFLDGQTDSDNRIALCEINLTGSYYHGDSLNQVTKSAYQPLNINNNGVKLEDGINSMVSGRVEGMAGNYLLFSLTPRVDLNENDEKVSLESGYLKTHLKNFQIQLGKDALWWGPGERGNLSLTNNATPFTAVQLSNLEPLRPDGLFKFLKQVDIVAFYADLEKNRGDSDVDGPGFSGLRIAATPSANFTITGTLNAIMGGVGHELHLSDLGDFFTGKNADTASGDKWDTIAGYDFRWRIPRLNGLQLYLERYGEDQAGKIPLPSKHAYLYGFDLPRLTPDGRWDLKFEMAATSDVWYVHGLYQNGYTYHDNLIGDAMGHNANRYYLRLSHYLTDGSRLTFNYENLIIERDTQYYRKVNSFWLGYYYDLAANLTLSAMVGYANIDNQNYQSDQSVHNYLARVGLSKRFN
jgi:hypothetical protein